MQLARTKHGLWARAFLSAGAAARRAAHLSLRTPNRRLVLVVFLNFEILSKDKKTTTEPTF